MKASEKMRAPDWATRREGCLEQIKNATELYDAAVLRLRDLLDTGNPRRIAGEVERDARTVRTHQAAWEVFERLLEEGDMIQAEKLATATDRILSFEKAQPR